MVVLDTDHLTLLGRSTGQVGHRLKARLADAGVTVLVTTIVTYEEQARGWLALLSKVQAADRLVENYRHLMGLVEDYRSIRVLEFDRDAAIALLELKPARIRVGTMDLRIASIVLARGAPLLSRNLGDFRKVPGLKVEDWSGSPVEG